jgi:hypothetical protein
VKDSQKRYPNRFVVFLGDTGNNPVESSIPHPLESEKQAKNSGSANFRKCALRLAPVRVRSGRSFPPMSPGRKRLFRLAPQTYPCEPPCARLSQDSNILRKNFTDAADGRRYIPHEQPVSQSSF